MTPLHYACQAGRAQNVEFICKLLMQKEKEALEEGEEMKMTYINCRLELVRMVVVRHAALRKIVLVNGT